MYRLPAVSTATPAGFLNAESAAGQPSPRESVCPAQPVPCPAKVVINELTAWICAWDAAASSNADRTMPAHLNRNFIIGETSLFLECPSLQLAGEADLASWGLGVRFTASSRQRESEGA